jgi:predicted DsbA family dithiol-disulfide isomerase
MRTVIPIYFDYASTLCYVAWRITSQLESELEIEALWKGVPIKLRDRRAAAGRDLSPSEREKVAIVAAETGISVIPPEHWLDTKAALEGSELAREAGVFAAYHELTFRAAFEDRQDIGNLAVVARIAAQSGMNERQFRAEITSGRMAPKIAENKHEADRFSALGYPTFILGDFPLIGIQPIDTMRLLFRRYMEQRTAEPGS